MQTIYIDILVILNIYVNYFLLRTTAKITHSSLKNKRCIAASIYGSLYSLLILIPHINAFLNVCIKFVAAVTIVILAFGYSGKTRLIINSISFFTVNFIFAGVIYAVYSWLKPDFMHFNNTYFYIDFSLVLLVVVTAALYFAVCIVRYLFDRIPENSGCYKIIIRYKEKTASLDGLADTGNSLVDCFSGNPVIVCGESSISAVADVSEYMLNSEKIPRGFRLIPCATINSSNMMPVFRPDEITIIDTKNGIAKNVEAMIGICHENRKAIFNPKLLKL